MTNSVPSHLLKMRVVHEIPRHLFSEASPPPADMQDRSKRLSFLRFLRQSPSATAATAQSSRLVRKDWMFNVAVWLDFPVAPNKPVSLWLMCEDGKGRHAELIDEQIIGDATSLMLSGNVRIQSRGDIQSLRIACAGLDDNDRFSLSEQHIKLIEAKQEALKAS